MPPEKVTRLMRRIERLEKEKRSVAKSAFRHIIQSLKPKMPSRVCYTIAAAFIAELDDIDGTRFRGTFHGPRISAVREMFEVNYTNGTYLSAESGNRDAYNLVCSVPVSESDTLNALVMKHTKLPETADAYGINVVDGCTFLDIYVQKQNPQ